MAELGRAALLVTLGLSVYDSSREGSPRGAASAGSRTPRETRSSPRSARRSSRLSSSSSASSGTTSRSRTSRGTRARRCPCSTRSQPSGAGRRARCSSGCSCSPAMRRSLSGSRANARATSSCGSRRSSAGSRWASPGCWWRSEPVRHDRRAPGRERAQPEPPEPVHGRPPGLPLSRVRRPRGAVRLRDGSAPLRPDRRTVDRRHAPLDDRRLDRPRHRPAARRALGIRGGGVGRLLRLGPRRERGAHSVARRDRVPALGDDPGEAGDAPRLERDAREPRVLPVAVRHFPDPLGRRELHPLVHPERHRALVPRLHRGGRRVLDRDDLAPAATAPHDRKTRVARLPRGGVPLQQPSPRRALPDDPLGDGVAHRLGGRARRVGRRRSSVLRLLPADLRVAPPAADGDRPARRMAARVARRARAGGRVARRHRGRHGAPARRPRGGFVHPGPDRVHLLGVRPLCHRRRVRARDDRPARPHRGADPDGLRASRGANRRRYGGYVVHAAVVLLAIGVAGSSAYDSVTEGRLARGESLAVGGTG